MLGHKTALSGSLMVAARLISRVIDLITMLVLARLLSPADFGLVAIAMTIIFIVEAALELPLSQALVRLPDIKPAYYDTAFTLAILRGLALCAIVCASATPFAAFYREPALFPLICVLSIAPAARGMLNPRMAQFAKDLNFKWEFMFELVSKIIAFAAGAAIAILTHSYWSIAVNTVIAPVLFAGMSYFVKPFRPKLTLSEWRVFSDFLGWMSLAQIIMAITWQSDQLLLGKLTRPSQLGMYTTANNVAGIPLAALFSPLMRPLLSAFAALTNEPARLASSYQNAASAVVTIGLPLLVGESMAAGPIVHLLLGNKWLGAIPMLQWLTLSLIPSLFAMPLAPLAMSLNKTRVFVRRNLFEMSVKLPFVIAGAIMYGFAGVIGARIISETATSIFCMFIIRRLTGIPVLKQLGNCWRGVVAVCAMALVLAMYSHWLGDGKDTTALAMELIAKIILGAAAYCGTLAVLWITSGKPSGLEATVMNTARHFLRKNEVQKV